MNKETIERKITKIIKEMVKNDFLYEEYQSDLREILEKHLLKEEEPKKDKIEIIRHPFPDGELCRAKINEIISYLNNHNIG